MADTGVDAEKKLKPFRWVTGYKIYVRMSKYVYMHLARILPPPILSGQEARVRSAQRKSRTKISVRSRKKVHLFSKKGVVSLNIL